MFTEDMSVFFNTAEFAHEAVRPMPDGSTQTAAVIFDRPDGFYAGEMVLAPEAQILYQVGAFAGLGHGEALTIEGKQWKVTSLPERIEDGRLMKAQLKQVNG